MVMFLRATGELFMVTGTVGLLLGKTTDNQVVYQARTNILEIHYVRKSKMAAINNIN